MPSEKQDSPCLSPDQVSTLAEYALKLEAHYKNPQDIEWALDQKGRSADPPVPAPSCPVVSEAAAPGLPTIPDLPHPAGRGRRSLSRSRIRPGFPSSFDEDLIDFPEGAVLVAKHSSPKFVIVMKKARGYRDQPGQCHRSYGFPGPGICRAFHPGYQGGHIPISPPAGNHRRRLFRPGLSGKVPELLALQPKKGISHEGNPGLSSPETGGRLDRPIKSHGSQGPQFCTGILPNPA